ncbi:replication protein RepA [Muricoccus radiodurans]|uniref:replication protein RepA n=1 Tax=Muricoccus radiodurans TaxID=2231721 RepID=UPI003CE81FAD
MGTVHQLLETKGRKGALEAGIERSVVEVAAAYLSDEDSGLGFAYSGWAQCALPHKRLADDAPWGIVSERVKLMVEPGRRQVVASDGSQTFEFVGVPFGSHARLILLYLQTEALRTGSREVELGGSMRGWLARVGIPAGGMTGKSVRDQAERISRCKLTFDISTGSRASGLVQQTIVDRALFIEAEDAGGPQGRLSLETAKLSEGFFEQLKKHPVPLEEAAIKALSNNAPALDVYLWLAYRLHALKENRLVPWTALKGQFGTGFSKLYHFKNKFPGTLALAQAVYPDAKVEVTEKGVVLKPSRPPVAPRQITLPSRN